MLGELEVYSVIEKFWMMSKSMEIDDRIPMRGQVIIVEQITKV